MIWLFACDLYCIIYNLGYTTLYLVDNPVEDRNSPPGEDLNFILSEDQVISCPIFCLK